MKRQGAMKDQDDDCPAFDTSGLERAMMECQLALKQLKENVRAFQTYQLAIEYFKRARPDCDGCLNPGEAHSVKCLNFSEALKILNQDFPKARRNTENEKGAVL